MPREVTDWSTLANANTEIGSIFIGEGWAPRDINNAIREMMAQLRVEQDRVGALEVVAGTGLTGGGDISDGPTLNVDFAGDADIAARTSTDKAVTPAQLPRSAIAGVGINSSDSTTANERTLNIDFATNAEATARSITNKPVSPAQIPAQINAGTGLTSVSAGPATGTSILSTNFATEDEANAGTATDRTISPATLPQSNWDESDTDSPAFIDNKPAFVPPSREITAGTGLEGGGDLAADRTLSVDFATRG